MGDQQAEALEADEAPPSAPLQCPEIVVVLRVEHLRNALVLQPPEHIALIPFR